jgi:cytochrome c
MKNLENNKMMAAILVAGLIALLTGKVASFIYHPVKDPEKRGFQVEVLDEQAGVVAQKVEEVLDIPVLMASATIDGGQKVFKKCAACHTYKSGEPHKLGPNLSGLVNSKIAGKAGYSYSDALVSNGKSWTHDELFAFLKKPRDYAPGTKMSFAGLKKPQQIADVIKFLEGN